MEKKYIAWDEIEVINCRCMEEAETIINWSRKDETASIYTSDNTFVTKIKQKVKFNPTEYKCWEAGRDDEGKVTGYFFEMPLKYLSFRGGSDPAALERLKTLRK